MQERKVEWKATLWALGDNGGSRMAE